MMSESEEERERRKRKDQKVVAVPVRQERGKTRGVISSCVFDRLYCHSHCRGRKDVTSRHGMVQSSRTAGGRRGLWTLSGYLVSATVTTSAFTRFTIGS